MNRCVLAALLLLLPGAAFAQRRLAIVDLVTPPGMVGLSSEIQSLVATEAGVQGYTTVTPDQLRASLGDAGFDALTKCQDDAGCVAAKLERLKIDRAVLGSLSRDEKSYLVKLYLVGVSGSPRVLSTVDRSILIAGRRFKQDVESALPGLLRGEQEALGTLDIRTSTPGATLTVDGEPVGLTPIKAQLKPGKHEYVVEKSGYLPVRRFANVEAHRTTVDELKLLRVPGQGGVEEASGSAPAAPGVHSEASSGSFKVPAGAWALIGVAGVAAIVGAVFGSTSQGLQDDLKKGYDADTQIYAGNRTDALEAKTDATIANVCFIGAGAALVGGVIWAVVGGQPKQEPVHAGISVGPQGGALTVGGKF